MEEASVKQYQCVNCGEPAPALIKHYGPTVLKLTKCASCGSTVDKYVEYDPVIVMIDLVLMSREAQRHVLYNTDFQHYWKLLVVLMLLETYVTWRPDSVSTLLVGAVCGTLTPQLLPDIIHYNYTQLQNLNYPEPMDNSDWWKSSCAAWTHQSRGIVSDLFIWEKDFYIKFMATFIGVAMFLITTQCLTRIIHYFTTQTRVSVLVVLKSYSMSGTTCLWFVPALVWTAHPPLYSALSHYLLVHLYTVLTYTTLYTVIFRTNKMVSLLVILLSYITRFGATFCAISIIKQCIV